MLTSHFLIASRLGTSKGILLLPLYAFIECIETTYFLPLYLVIILLTGKLVSQPLNETWFVLYSQIYITQSVTNYT